jgi:proline dehydrogenase
VIDRLLARTVPALPRSLVRRFADPYIAGEHLDDAIATVRALNAAGKLATIDVLGEAIATRAEAEAIRDGYLRVLDAIAREELDADVSVKPTGLGLVLDPALCVELVAAIASRAAASKTTVEIDMEDSSATTATLDVYRRLRASGHDNVGIVLQAMLRRTPDDVAALAPLRPSVRICKGIYVEPPTVALQGFDEVRAAWVAALRALVAADAYPAIATHDPHLVREALRIVRHAGLARDQYEFQMLLGVHPALGDRLVRDGHRVRIYVPFGARWYEYCVRRLRENPALARAIAGGTLRRLAGRA